MYNPKSLKIAFFAISVLCCLLYGCKKNADINTKEGSKVHFVLNRDINQGDYITIPVTIENQEYNFILDTGSEVVVVDKNLRHLFGESIKKNITPLTMENITIQMEAAGPAKSFFIGIGDRISFAGHVGVCDLSKFGLAGYDGIIGMDLLRQIALLLDFENNRIEFATELELLKYDDCVCSISLLPNERFRPFVSMNFAGVSENFLVDTGLPGTSFLRQEIYDNICDANEQYTAMLDTIDGQREGKVIGVDEVILGNLKYSHLGFIRAHNSIIGLHFFKQHKKVVFDFRGWKIYLAP